jgi:hypothetical protein
MFTVLRATLQRDNVGTREQCKTEAFCMKNDMIPSMVYGNLDGHRLLNRIFALEHKQKRQ